MNIILVKGQQFSLKWTKNTKDWYIKKGYLFTKLGDYFIVKAEDLSKGSHINVDVKCDFCNETISVAWKDYYNYKGNKYSCKKCRQKKTSENNLLERQKQLYEEAQKFCTLKNYTLLTKMKEIKDSNTIISYICPKHGLQSSKIYALVSQHGCKCCQYDSMRLTTKDVENTFKEYGCIILNSNEYVDYKTKNLKVICNECGNEFITSYNSFVTAHGQYCSSCSGSESKGERKVRHFLEDYNINFIQEYTFPNCKDKNVLPFDFYLTNYNYIIEYDGMQHFEPVSFNGKDATKNLIATQRHDKIKNDYCKQHKIKIIRIPYWDYDKIDHILKNELNLHKDIV